MMKLVITLGAIFGVAAVAGCTLLLPTQDLIQSCTAQADCPDGFICEDQACLPADEEDSGAEEEEEED